MHNRSEERCDEYTRFLVFALKRRLGGKQKAKYIGAPTSHHGTGAQVDFNICNWIS